jgi:hypothetical protein
MVGGAIAAQFTATTAAALRFDCEGLSHFTAVSTSQGEY